MSNYSDAQMPIDKTGSSIQVLGVDESTVLNLTAGAVSSFGALPGVEDSIIELTVTEIVRIAFGLTGVTASATSRLLNPGTYVYRRLARQTHVAVIEVAAAGGSISVVALL